MTAQAETDETRRPYAPGIEILPEAVLRAACWPIETLDAFAAPECAEAARVVLAGRRASERRRSGVLAALYRLIPHVTDRGTRAQLLAVRRAVFASDDRLPYEPGMSRLPLGVVDPQSVALVRYERQARDDLASSHAVFLRTHAEALERSRALLREITSSERFGRALVVANPAVASQWRHSTRHTPGRTRTHRLEATVFRYLLRAVGRATPNGAWAGTATVSPDPEDGAPQLRVVPEQPASHAWLDLRPFARVLDGLARALRYRRDVPLRLVVTAFEGPGGWRYETTGIGESGWRAVPDDPFLRLVLDAYRDGKPRLPRAFLNALTTAGYSFGPRIATAIDRLIDLGALTNDIALPSGAVDPWSALRDVAGRLLPADRARWERVITRLHDECAELSSDFESLTADEVDVCRARLVTEVQSLWEWVGIEGPVPADILHVDTRLPFRVAWSVELRGRVREAVREWLALHGALGVAERWRRIALDRAYVGLLHDQEVPLLDVLASAPILGCEVAADPDPPDTWLGAFARIGASDADMETVRAMCTTWHELVQTHPWAPRITVPASMLASRPLLAGPAGAVSLVVGADDLLWVGRGRPQPGYFAARQGFLVEPRRELFARWRLDHVDALELVSHDARNPSFTVGTRVIPSFLQPHGRDGPSIADLTLLVDSATARPWLRHAASTARVVIAFESAAAVGDGDACTRLLVRLALGHGWELLAGGFLALPQERARWRHLPRIELPGGAVLSARRWTIDGDDLAVLAAATGTERYLTWRALVERLGLPDIALVRLDSHPDAPPLALRTDSPLAVQCVLGDLPDSCERIVVTELPDNLASWPVADEDGHYLAELAVTWHDETFWARVTCGEESGP